MRALDLTGQRFGRLVALHPAERKGRDRTWLCRCDCGQTLVVISASLRSRNTASCGCLKAETAATITRSHGRAGTQKYWVWADMVGRCTNPKHKGYSDYGGRGIRVCERWRNSFAAFMEDMGPRPTGGTLERQDNAGNYEPGNAIWASRVAQANNKRNNRLITFGGQTKSMADWARSTGISYSAIKYRLNRGWPTERVLGENR